MAETKMKICCPKCGQWVSVIGLGRRPLNIPFTEVCEAIQQHHSTLLAAQSLGCSVPYLYKVLKAHGTSPAEVLKGGLNNVD
jgi:AraC-like DNA-binding protein